MLEVVFVSCRCTAIVHFLRIGRRSMHRWKLESLRRRGVATEGRGLVGCRVGEMHERGKGILAAWEE